MAQWILKTKGGRGTITNAEDKSDMKVTRLMNFIEVTDPKEAVRGLQIRFLYEHKEGTIYWLEGTIVQRVTKLSRAKKLKYTENFVRIGNIRVINTWGEDPKPLPVTVCINLTSDVGWTKVSARALPVDEGSTI